MPQDDQENRIYKLLSEAATEKDATRLNVLMREVRRVMDERAEEMKRNRTVQVQERNDF
jgi:hypothetical protein